MDDLLIRDATAEDAPLIARAILEAIGEDLTANLAGENHSREEVESLFTRLALRSDSQYSFMNTRVACSPQGIVMGVCVSYDGRGLKQLRRSFFEEANRTLGWDITPEEIENVTPETDADEYYLDTLMTLPEYRGCGVASSLIADAKRKADLIGKPLGLLCDSDNLRARRLYDGIGFRQVGQRPFAGTEMDHLQL